MTIIEQAERLYKKVGTFILSCIDSDGFPLTKAVVPGKHRESLKELYFATNTSSKYAMAICENTKASVYFYHKGLTSWKGCFLKGEMKIITDMCIKEKYWQKEFKDAYPQKSFIDPDFCVLRFTPTVGKFYENFKIEDFEIINADE